MSSSFSLRNENRNKKYKFLSLIFNRLIVIKMYIKHLIDSTNLQIFSKK